MVVCILAGWKDKRIPKVSEGLFFSLWMNKNRPILARIRRFHGFREDWNIPGLTMQGLRSTLKKIRRHIRKINDSHFNYIVTSGILSQIIKSALGD